MAETAPKPAGMTPEQIAQYKAMIDRVYKTIVDAVARLDAKVGLMADARFKDQLALYKSQLVDRFTPQTQLVLAYPDTDAFWQDKERMQRLVAQFSAFVEQVKATTTAAGVDFWDGFLDTFLENAKRQWEKLPDPLKPFDWLPWIVGAALFGPFILRTFAGYQRGGAAEAAEAGATEIDRKNAAASQATAAVGKVAMTAWMRR